MKRCPASFVIKEMQIKTTGCHYIPIRVVKTKNNSNKNNTSAGEDTEQGELSFRADGNAK